MLSHASFKPVAFTLIAIGACWIFAEIRRLIIHTADFLSEAVDDAIHRRAFSLITAAFLLLAGIGMAFWAYDLPVPTLTSQFPFVSDVPATHPYVVRIAWGCAGLLVFSILSVWILPPPLFPESVTGLFSAVVRIILFAGLVFILIHSLPKIGDHWLPDAIGLGLALLTLRPIFAGSFENWGLFWERLRPISCEERPFTYIGTMLWLLFAVWVLLVGNPIKSGTSSIHRQPAPQLG